MSKICCPRPRSLRCVCGEPVQAVDDCCCRRCFLEFQSEENEALSMLAEVARVVRTPCCKSSQQAQLLTAPPQGSCCLEPAQQQWQAEAAIVADYQRLSSLASSQCHFPSQFQDQRTSSSAPSEPSQVQEDEQAASASSPGKQCTRCLAYLPLDDFCINKRSPDGHFTQCRACVAEKDRERYRKRQRRGNGPRVSSKVCSSCHKEKPKDEFHRDPSKSLGLQTYCKACLAVKQAARKAQLK